jgi:hypothetical protein
MATTVPPNTTNWDDFFEFHEEFTFDDSTELEFLCTTFLLINDNDNAFVGSLGMPRLVISLQQANDCLRQIPDHEIYPPAHGDIAIYAPT